MGVLDINLREIHLKREEIKGNVKIKKIGNNINIINIREEEIPAIKSKALILTFEYKSTYEMESPKDGVFGTMHFVGEVVYSDKKKILDSLLKTWKKEHKLDEKVLLVILQAAFNLVNTEAICLSKKVLLPTPIRLPQITLPEK